MKKLLIFLLAALLLTGCGKEAAVPVTTAPAESTDATTQPAETTLPPETTAPTGETTLPTQAVTEATTEATTEPTTASTEPAAVHTHSYTATVIPATCTAPGTTSYFCECGDNYTEGKTPPQGHSFGDWVIVKAPTDTEPGLEQRVCADCGETEDNYIS